MFNDNLLPAFGVRDAGIDVFDHGSGGTLATSISSAYENEEPWFGYYWPPTAVTTDFAEDHPELTEFLSNMTFLTETMNEILDWMNENSASGEEGAVYFLTNNPDS